jgi:hypothetical protein
VRGNVRHPLTPVKLQISVYCYRSNGIGLLFPLPYIAPHHVRSITRTATCQTSQTTISAFTSNYQKIYSCTGTGDYWEFIWVPLTCHFTEKRFAHGFIKPLACHYFSVRLLDKRDHLQEVVFAKSSGVQVPRRGEAFVKKVTAHP